MEEETSDFKAKLPLLLALLALLLALGGLYLGYTAKDKANSNQITERQITTEVANQLAAEKRAAQQEAKTAIATLENEARALNQKINKSKGEISAQAKKDTNAVANELKKNEANITNTERTILQQLTQIHKQINRLNTRIDLTNQRINSLQTRLSNEGV